MTDYIPPIIQATELLKLYQAENLVLVDVSSGNNAKKNYKKKHLDGAFYIDLNSPLADIKEELSDGDRHPLPNIIQFSET